MIARHPFRTPEVRTRAVRGLDRRTRLRAVAHGFTQFAFMLALATFFIMAFRLVLALQSGALR